MENVVRISCGVLDWVEEHGLLEFHGEIELTDGRDFITGRNLPGEPAKKKFEMKVYCYDESDPPHRTEVAWLSVDASELLKLALDSEALKLVEAKLPPEWRKGAVK